MCCLVYWAYLFDFKAQILSKYNLKFGGKKFSVPQNRILLGSNIDDCARSCNEELGFDCKSFDFCFLSGDCRLSKNSITNGDQDFDESFDCDVYEKDSRKIKIFFA